MKTNELRIGNYVKIDNILCEIVEIYEEAVYCYDKYGEDSHNINVVEPIELTEEVLLKIGFEKGDTSSIYQRYYLEVCGNGQSSFFRYDFYYNEQRRLGITFRNREGVENEFKKYDIKYLHQLQNVYFILTGKELEVEL